MTTYMYGLPKWLTCTKMNLIIVVGNDERATIAALAMFGDPVRIKQRAPHHT